MSITYKDGGSTRDVTEVYYKDGGSTRTIVEVYIGDGGTKRLIWPEAIPGGPPDPTLAATASPSSPYGSRSTGGTATTNIVTATPTGYTGTVTYAWEYVSGDATVAVSSASSANVTFSGNVSIGTPVRAATWKCKVTDSGGFVYTNNVSITLEYTGGP